MSKRNLLASILLVSFLTGCGIEDPEKGVDHTIGMDTDYEANSLLEDGTGKKARVLILSGQSNVTGCSITSYLKDQVSAEKFSTYENGYPNIHINFNIDNHRTCSEGQWRKTDLLCGSYEAEFGPEVGLADKLNATFPGEEFYIIKFSMSGYSLNYHWLKDGGRGEIYYAQYLYIKTALDYLSSLHYDVSLDAFLWNQGESDSNDYKAARYYDNQKKFMSYLREDFRDYTAGELKFIDSGISDSPYCLPGGPTINAAKKRIAKEDENDIFFSTIENGLTTMNEPYYEPDLGHYDALSEIKLGELFADAVASLYAK